jgi:hypothetical protein
MVASPLNHPTLRRRTLLLCLGALAASGCVSTSLIDRWKDAAYSGPAMHKVLVVGVQKNEGRRRLWEDGMAQALAHEGVQATASYTLFATKAPDAAELSATAAREGFDGVFESHLMGTSQRLYASPGYGGFGLGFGWPFFGVWDGFYEPGYVETEERADYQTDVYTVDAAGGQLVWTGVTRSIDLSSTHSITRDISHVLVPALIQEGILAGHSR